MSASVTSPQSTLWVRTGPTAIGRSAPPKSGPSLSPIRPTVHVVGHRLEREHHRLRDFLTRTAQPHEFYEADSVEGQRLLGSVGAGDAPLPVLIDGEEVHGGATVERIARVWKAFAQPSQSHYELAIVGAGPPGWPLPSTEPLTACRLW
jgi:hypothetical protein